VVDLKAAGGAAAGGGKKKGRAAPPSREEKELALEVHRCHLYVQLARAMCVDRAATAETEAEGGGGLDPASPDGRAALLQARLLSLVPPAVLPLIHDRLGLQSGALKPLNAWFNRTFW
jgi:hypothetical protein